MSKLKQYLGDFVYADFDGFSVTLTTENGNDPSNTIVLEPAVIKALIDYPRWAKEQWDLQREQILLKNLDHSLKQAEPDRPDQNIGNPQPPKKTTT